MKKIIMLMLVSSVFSTAYASESTWNDKHYSTPSECLSDSSIKESSYAENYFAVDGSCYDARHYCIERNGSGVVARGGLNSKGEHCSPDPLKLTLNLDWRVGN